jgi:hypothetical protein
MILLYHILCTFSITCHKKIQIQKMGERSLLFVGQAVVRQALSPLFLCRKQPQRKSYQKETAYAGLRAPNPRRLLKKVGENFSKKFKQTFRPCKFLFRKVFAGVIGGAFFKKRPLTRPHCAAKSPTAASGCGADVL